MLVADYCNNSIAALNRSMTDARHLSLPVDGLQRPASLYLDESRDRLYVGEGGGHYRVLVFDDVCGIEDMFNSWRVGVNSAE